MISIFDKVNKIDLTKLVCHSGGAEGSDFFFFENIGEEFGITTRAYSYKTPRHQSKNKVEISNEDYLEGVIEVKKANRFLNRYGIDKYMNMLARNWSQVKYSDEIFAIGYIIKVGERNNRGYYNRGKYDMVDGGTGYAVQMGINNQKPIYIYEQKYNKWFRWSYSSFSFIEMDDCPKISYQNFAGIGTRQITQDGIESIRNVYKKTFGLE